MVSLFKYATVAALVAVCSASVEIAGKKPTKPPKPVKKPKPTNTVVCNPAVITAMTCVDSSNFKYCDDTYSVWMTDTMDSDMTCDANGQVVGTSSASAIGKGPAAMAFGVAVAIWSFL
ncbi:hypothetical protein GGI13_001480 [Coemansia sp. RSA 455]|nr:hypothetical protein GGI13_001480 [Coemansia sp. RSA 455]